VQTKQEQDKKQNKNKQENKQQKKQTKASKQANTSAILARVRTVNLGIILAFPHQTEVEHTAHLGIGKTSARTFLYCAVREEKEQTEIMARCAGRQAGNT